MKSGSFQGSKGSGGLKAKGSQQGKRVGLAGEGGTALGGAPVTHS